MTKIKKYCVLLIALIMVVSVFSACGGKNISETSDNLTYWASLDSRHARTHTSLSEIMYVKEICKATGIDVDFIHPAAGSTGTEAFQILMASGEYPDMIEYEWGNYAGGPDSAIRDGVIIALNDYLEDYAPNYYDYMEGNKGKEAGGIYKAQAMSSKGNYYGFHKISLSNYRGYSGIFIRKDLLDKWGLDIPVTIDDWENVFKVAKENGIKYPFVSNNGLDVLGSSSLFSGAWEVGKGFYLDNDEVKFGPNEPALKAYVAKMAEWMKKGYLDPDYVTNTYAEMEAYITNGTSIASAGYIGSHLGRIIPAMQERDPNFNIVACPFPVMKEGDTPWFQSISPDVAPGGIVAVSVQCGENNEDRYKEAVKWLDYCYSEEGAILRNFGIEGDTYTLENDDDGNVHYVYTDKITKAQVDGANSVEDAMFYFVAPGGNLSGMVEHPDYFEGFYPYSQQKEALKIWNANLDEARKHVIPPIVFTDEEAERIAQIEASEKDNFIAAISNIILGKASIDTYDAAVAKAKKNGYDEIHEFYKAAYARYKKNLAS